MYIEKFIKSNSELQAKSFKLKTLWISLGLENH